MGSTSSRSNERPLFESSVERIDTFREQYAFLSNMFHTRVWFKGGWWNASENIYQSYKAEGIERRIFPGMASNQSKRYWKDAKIRNPHFHENKLEYMELALRAKFKNPHLANLLKKTYPAELVEGNWWGDRFWGECQGTGDNNLGKLLMQIRLELLNGIRLPTN